MCQCSLLRPGIEDESLLLEIVSSYKNLSHIVDQVQITVEVNVLPEITVGLAEKNVKAPKHPCYLCAGRIKTVNEHELTLLNLNKMIGEENK